MFPRHFTNTDYIHVFLYQLQVLKPSKFESTNKFCQFIKCHLAFVHIIILIILVMPCLTAEPHSIDLYAEVKLTQPGRARFTYSAQWMYRTRSQARTE